MSESTTTSSSEEQQAQAKQKVALVIPSPPAENLRLLKKAQHRALLNAVALTIIETQKFFSYAVIFTTGDIVSAKLKRVLLSKVIKPFSEDSKDKLFVANPNQLITNFKLPQDEQQLTAVWKARTGETLSYEIMIKFQQEISAKSSANEGLACLAGAIIKRVVTNGMNLKECQNVLVDFKAKVKSTAKYDVYTAYAFMTKVTETKRLLVQLSKKNKIVCRQTALDFIKDPRSKPSMLVGMSVLTTYNNKTYRVTNIESKMTPEDPMMGSKTNETYIAYYKRAYGISIRDTRQPLLISYTKHKGARNKIHLIPELCLLIGIQEKRELATLRLGEPPAQKVQALKELGTKISSLGLESYGLKVDPKLVETPLYQLEAEKVRFKAGEITPRNGGWMSCWKDRSQVAAPVNVMEWALIALDADNRDAGKLIDQFLKIGGGAGVEVRPPVEIYAGRDYSGEGFIEAWKKQRPTVQIIVILLPNANSERYRNLKTYFSSTETIPTQCITKEKVAKGLSVTTNVFVGIQTKLGGLPWTVNLPFKNPALLVGIDVSHSQKANRDSCGAICFADSKDHKYSSRIFFTRKNEEVNDRISTHLVEAVEQYEAKYKAKPTAIFIFRDGVGEGQFEACLETELSLIVQKFSKINWQPPICYVVVSKTSNFKMFSLSQGTPASPEVGSVVDANVTNGKHWEYYLSSAHANQGCANPCRYTVLYNRTSVRPDILIQLTYKLCHCYYNWQGSIRVPAPLMYAHKAAAMVGQHTRVEPSLKNGLWFV